MKRGSALLIVLGMMAFMVISAVAFSAWMRYERLPNSYLRRASSSRLLVKAALAEAIDQIDAAIGENAHPGVGMIRPRQGVGAVASDNNGVQNENLDNRNVWAQRVYLGTNSVNNLASVNSTVSTLTFEGLAYIPPPLVNYARYYSRRSTAGQWKGLGFDSGRYAFCAIDVSDYLDVNLISANFGRGSSPGTRLSLAYLCENEDHTGYSTQPSAWDTFMKNFWPKTAAEAAIANAGQTTVANGAQRTDTSKVPLVSLADFNLALYDKKPGGVKSPFCEYVKNGYDAFYNNKYYTSEEDQNDSDFVHRMTLVTDSYFPPEGGDTIDLTTEAGQPFTRALLERAGPDYGSVMNNGSTAAVRLRDRISKLGLVMLYDYLDDDSIPVSLSIPSVERVPMIAGFQPNFAGQLAAANPTPGNEYCVQTGGAKPDRGSTAMPKITMQQATTYKLNAQQFSTPGSVKVVATYPFRRGRDIADGAPTFKVDGLVEYFFTSGNMDFRPNDGGGFLHPVVRNNRLEPENPCDGVLCAQLSESDYRPSNVNPQSENDQSVIKELTLETQGSAQTLYNAVDQRPILTVVKQWTENWEDDGSGTGNGRWVKDEASEEVIPEMSGGDNAKTVCGIVPLRADGSPDADFSTPSAVAGWLAAGKTIRLRMAVWLRVRDENNKTVDLVPACMADDKSANGQNDNNDMSMGPEGAVQLGGRYPIMRFDGAEVTLGMGGPTFGGGNSAPFGLSPTAVMCPDPRWNWAPEHWFVPGGDLNANTWLQNCGKDAAGRDCDIFMATSDAGYMQSVYELAFLPRVTGNDDGTLRSDGQFGNVENPNDGRASWAAAIGNVRNLQFMWKTYRSFNHGGLRRDDLEEIGLVSQGGGEKLNPYSDSTNVLMAAFANTPLDWWCAATLADTDIGVPKSDRSNAANFNKKYAFSPMNPNAQFDWDDLQEVAGNFMDCIRRRAQFKLDSSISRVWEEVFDGTAYDRDGNPLRNQTVPQGQYLDWDGENSWFCGIQDGEKSSNTAELFDVDRKFLYGYWRDCFALQQQLFLVFVRAEPMMMGGGAAGRTPPQLGARAVALVWRDPYGTGDNLKPHRTRVLFYRQFD